MDWKVLIIGLIPLGVWILSTILRGIEDAREQENPRPGPGERPLKTPRRPTSELDRFLEEARRRRDAAPKKPTEEIPLLEALPSVRQPDPLPAPRVERKPPKPRDLPKPPPSPPMPTVVAELPAPPPAPARLPPTQSPAPVLAKVVAMLRNRDAVITAVVLREILDRPLSQRR